MGNISPSKEVEGDEARKRVTGLGNNREGRPCEWEFTGGAIVGDGENY